MKYEIANAPLPGYNAQYALMEYVPAPSTYAVQPVVQGRPVQMKQPVQYSTFPCVIVCPHCHVQVCYKF